MFQILEALLIETVLIVGRTPNNKKTSRTIGIV